MCSEVTAHRQKIASWACDQTKVIDQEELGRQNAVKVWYDTHCSNVKNIHLNEMVSKTLTKSKQHVTCLMCIKQAKSIIITLG